MFKIGQKAAELERTKLQLEIQRQQSELRCQCAEKRLKVATKGTRKSGRKGGPVKSPKKKLNT